MIMNSKTPQEAAALVKVKDNEFQIQRNLNKMMHQKKEPRMIFGNPPKRLNSENNLKSDSEST